MLSWQGPLTQLCQAPHQPCDVNVLDHLSNSIAKLTCLVSSCIVSYCSFILRVSNGKKEVSHLLSAPFPSVSLGLMNCLLTLGQTGQLFQAFVWDLKKPHKF